MYFIPQRIKKILAELESYIFSCKIPVPSFKMKEGKMKEGYKLDSSTWKDFGKGDRWGARDYYGWFTTKITIPDDFDGRTVVMEVGTDSEGGWQASVNPQFIAYLNGEIMHGLDANHRHVFISEKASAGEQFNVTLKAYSGMKEGLSELNSYIYVYNENIERLYYNIKVPLDTAVLLDDQDKRRIDILRYLNNTINIIDLRKPFSNDFLSSIIEATQYIEKEFYTDFCGHDDVKVICVGHTHIDVAWLWTIEQTREKAARSFSTVLDLMKKYPDYKFMSSQPQIYKFIQEDYPELFNEIKKRVSEGRWEPEGAMWLEADCNVISGESLVRQILFGKRFFFDEFGVESRVLWLPDVFGYSAALPQILKKCGIDYFMTTKISWNEYNKMPYDTFMWKGIDGTKILTYFITTSDYEKVLAGDGHKTIYNGRLAPNQIMGCWRRFQQKDLTKEILMSFGFGDGGGGPTRDMLENAKRIEKGIPGCPKVEMGKVLDFFKSLDLTVSGNRNLPEWVGELYLEYHRGTYTTMARNKKYNRKCEFLYQDVEVLSVLDILTGGGNCYPQERINYGWRKILLNQFHDIIPGSSIKEVYEDSWKDYKDITKDVNILISESIDKIMRKMEISKTSIIVFNQLGCLRDDIAEVILPDGWENVEIYDGIKQVDCQVYYNEGRKKAMFYAMGLPSKGFKAYIVKKTKAGEQELMNKMVVTDKRVSNSFFDILLDECGNIVSIFDKQNNREILKPGSKANVLQAFEDKPFSFDAWDINIYYSEKMWEVNDLESVKVIENGKVRAVLRIKKKFLDSSITQDMIVYSRIPRIDFKTRIDWKEKQILLKAAFPVDIHSDKATYEIQYGNVERPTHWNTSWDYARFEVCAHKWADLSEDDYGVSLLNDCKYGYDIKDSVMRLTLLKSPIHPNENADREVHEFTYSLYPHIGDWKKAKTVNMAYNLNCPLYTCISEAHQGKLSNEFSLVSVNFGNVIIDTVKKAEDSDDIIIRMYECFNRKTNCIVTLLRSPAAVWECDFMEKNIAAVNTEFSKFELTLKPYEVKTFKVRFV